MRDERGFTLLEVLIASAIAAMVLGALMRTALTGIGTLQDASAYETATALARSHLALLGRDLADAAPDAHGSDGPFDWRVRLTPQAVASPGPGIVNWFLHQNEPRATLYAVTVTVSWMAQGHHRELHIDTQRLGFAPAPPLQTP